MRTRTAAGDAGLAAIVAAPARAVVALDFDGTLAPIVTRPEDSRPVPGALDALRLLADRVGTCAVVTGRAAAEAVRLGGFDGVPRLQVLGHYGLERWADGRLDSPDPPAAIDEARRLLAAVVAGAPPGVHLEDKHHSVVVHTRPADDPAGALDAVSGPAAAIAEELGLELVPGRFVVEVRPPGVDKGLAVRRLVEDADAVAVLYAGDDLGDLPAFAAVSALRDEGRCAGVTVASIGTDAPPELARVADVVVDGPDAVVELLRELAAGLG